MCFEAIGWRIDAGGWLRKWLTVDRGLAGLVEDVFGGASLARALAVCPLDNEQPI